MMSGAHRRVLLVEDDLRVGHYIADLLEEADYEVDGPHPSLADAMAALARQFPDCAILDIKLRQQDAGLIADDLAQYDIPFIFCSGRPSAGALGGQFPQAPFISKDQLASALLPALDRSIH